MITRRNLLFLLSSAGLTAGIANKTIAAPRQRQSSGLAGAVQNELYLQDFGAIPDGVTDNSEALQAAINELKNSCGGTIVFPAGVTKLAGSVSIDFLGSQGAIRLKGSGSNSVIHIATGTEMAIAIHNTSKLNVENLTFIGTHRESYDGDLFDCAHSVIFCSYVEQVTITDCKFLGIAINAPYDEPSNGYELNKHHGVISVNEGDLLVKRCYFGGCGTNQCANVNVNSWNALTIRDSQFLDYGYYNGQTVSKTGYVTNTAWVRAINQKPVTNARMRGKITIERTSFDEGCYNGLLLYGAQWVEIDNVSMNSGLSAAIVIVNVAHTRIKDSFVGYLNNNIALYAYHSKIVELDSILLGGNVKNIYLDAGVNKLISRYSTLSDGTPFSRSIINKARAIVQIVN